MKKIMVAYIDNYDEITFLVEKRGRYKAKSFYLYDAEDLVEELSVLYHATENNLIKIGLRVRTKLNLHHSYAILDDLNHNVPVYSGSVVRTAEFESEFYYDGPLGFDYTPSYTTFRVWSPVAKSIFIGLQYPDGRKERRELTYSRRGVWTVEISDDLDGVAYVYYVKLFEKYEKVLDPYALSSSANGEYNYVINLDKLYQPKYNKPQFSGYYTDAVVYEASIRDLTCSLSDENRGTFLGLVDEREDYGLNYISSLGVTHLQILPMSDFGGVDDIDKDKNYNWGYNPEQFFIPCGWYSKNPNDPYSRLNELLMLVDEAHKRNLRIVMDVVYNHVYEFKNFPFEKLVPGYFYRVDLYGNYTNVSGCGNDLATEKRMCSRFIIDNLKYWVKQFHISGFRFDLMGLLDIETLNHAYEELRKIEPEIIVYGEGWNMPNTIPDAFRPHSYNHYKMPRFAFFNDKYRDVLKGNQWNKSLGYAFGSADYAYDIFHMVTGSSLDSYRFQNPNQTVNYVECHDNFTFYDFAVKELKLSEEEAITGGRLALQIIAISLGIVFIHAGEEFYRTKHGVENSYNSNDSINLFDYQRRDLYLEDIEGLRELLQIRKEHPEFRMTNLPDIERKIHLIGEMCSEHVLCYCIDGSGYLLTILIKNQRGNYTFFANQSRMIFNGRRSCNLFEAQYDLIEPGVYIFKEDR